MSDYVRCPVCFKEEDECSSLSCIPWNCEEDLVCFCGATRLPYDCQLSQFFKIIFLDNCD